MPIPSDTTDPPLFPPLATLAARPSRIALVESPPEGTPGHLRVIPDARAAE